MAILTLLLCLLSLLLSVSSSLLSSSSSQREVHIFYYGWYQNPSIDHRWEHWNHRILPHWRPEITAQHENGQYQPPMNPGSTYYPARGLYSSSDPSVLAQQMAEIKFAGVDAITFGWHSNTPGHGDGEGVGTDHALSPVLDAAAQFGLKVNIHLEPYPNRTIDTIRSDIEYIMEHYGSHPAFYKREVTPGRSLPMFYCYDQYHLTATQWSQLLTSTGSKTVRDTPLDAIFVGLILDSSHLQDLKSAGFDAAYSYFSSNGFTMASTFNNWNNLMTQAKALGLHFLPSLGPGYDDIRIRPWNGQNQKARSDGRYYDKYWEKALELGQTAGSLPLMVSLTSYNEWGEGTQLEPAIPFRTDKGVQLTDYEGEARENAQWLREHREQYPYPEEAKRGSDEWSDGADFYIRRTKHWAQQYKEQTVNPEREDL